MGPAMTPPPAVAPIPDDPATARASARSTKLAVALGTMLALLCLASSIAWLFGDSTELREAVENTAVDEQTLEDAGMTRAEWDNLALNIARFGFFGLQLVVAILFAVFSSLMLRLRAVGRTGLFVLGLLGIMGSLLLNQINALAVIIGLLASGGLVVTTMLPATRLDLKRRQQSLAQAAAVGMGQPNNQPFPMPGQGYAPGQVPPTQPWSTPSQPQHPQYPQQAPPGYPPQGQHQQWAPASQPGEPQGEQPPQQQPDTPATAYVPEPAPWSDAASAAPVPAPARVAPTGSEIPEPAGPAPAHDAKWDPVEGVYTRWEPARSVWVRHVPETDDWVPLD